MQGLDYGAALLFIEKKVHAPHFPLLTDIPALLARMVELDIAYMRSTDVLDAEGYQGEGEYDEDDALEAILDRMARDVDEEQEIQLAALLDQALQDFHDYLDTQGFAEA